ncbi:MAG: hypothetical protein KC468_29255, partial [Myxococcales bacterium]|nr:hypothetical protein [Myxococcales bacterium]
MNPRLVSSVVVCAFVLGCSTGETGETRGSETGAATDMPSTTATSDTDDGGSTGSTGASTGEVTSGETGGDSSTGDETGDETTGEPLACWELPGPWHLGWEIPAPTPIDGDPVDGEWALLNEDYVSCGVPYDLFQLGKVFLGTYADGEQLAWREGKNANLPYNWNVVYSEGGTELAAMNCLTCHAGKFNGELVIGLGRHDADFTDDFGALLGLLPTLPEWTDAGKEINKFVGRYDALGPYIQTATIGTNPADNVAVILASHRDPDTLAWSDEQLIPIDPPVVPVDTPPWWRVKKKGGHFWNGMSRGDHRGTMMFASSLCVDTTEKAGEMLGYFNDIRAYLESLEAPQYPWAVDEQLAAQGKELFECSCAGCHGTYDDDPALETFPNLLIPLEVVGTDSLLGDLASSDLGTLVEWFNSSWYGEITQLYVDDPFVGYAAPPLDGVWATAPYLHNASVPTLELVLDSGKRPDFWRRVDYDSTNYDRDALGWPWEATGGQGTVPAGERRHVYDTSLLGYGNGGHTFGDKFTDS